jgi:hypothetical protein
MTTPALNRRLERASKAASERAQLRRNQPRLMSEEREWQDTLDVLEILIDCGGLPPPPPDCSASHTDPATCPACRSWQLDTERAVVEARYAEEQRLVRGYVQVFADAEDWPITAATRDVLYPRANTA